MNIFYYLKWSYSNVRVLGFGGFFLVGHIVGHAFNLVDDAQFLVEKITSTTAHLTRKPYYTSEKKKKEREVGNNYIKISKFDRKITLFLKLIFPYPIFTHSFDSYMSAITFFFFKDAKNERGDKISGYVCSSSG